MISHVYSEDNECADILANMNLNLHYFTFCNDLSPLYTIVILETCSNRLILDLLPQCDTYASAPDKKQWPQNKEKIQQTSKKKKLLR
jgi:hypothetical protein